MVFDCDNFTAADNRYTIGFGNAEKQWKGWRITKFLTLDGDIRCISEWSEITGISKYTIYDWYKKFGRVCTEYKVLEAWNRRAEDGK